MGQRVTEELRDERQSSAALRWWRSRCLSLAEEVARLRRELHGCQQRMLLHAEGGGSRRGSAADDAAAGVGGE
eukprot:gene4935-2092_t